jgi:hypothetical protein
VLLGCSPGTEHASAACNTPPGCTHSQVVTAAQLDSCTSSSPKQHCPQAAAAPWGRGGLEWHPAAWAVSMVPTRSVHKTCSCHALPQSKCSGNQVDVPRAPGAARRRVGTLVSQTMSACVCAGVAACDGHDAGHQHTGPVHALRLLPLYQKLHAKADRNQAAALERRQEQQGVEGGTESSRTLGRTQRQAAAVRSTQRRSTNSCVARRRGRLCGAQPIAPGPCGPTRAPSARSARSASMGPLVLCSFMLSSANNLLLCLMTGGNGLERCRRPALAAGPTLPVRTPR